jgi:ATP-dependent protease ClpP protease subunit
MKPKKCSDEDYSFLIKRKGTHIYFYEEIDFDTILDMKEKIEEVNKELDRRKIEDGDDAKDLNVYLHICSPGGCVWSGMNAIDIILKNKYPVTTIVEGIAASAATLLSIAGHRRLIQEHSVLLFHQIRGYVIGTHSEISDEKFNWDVYEDIIQAFYVKQSTVSKKKMKKITADEKVTTAQMALKLGFVHEII